MSERQFTDLEKQLISALEKIRTKTKEASEVKLFVGNGKADHLNSIINNIAYSAVHKANYPGS